MDTIADFLIRIKNASLAGRLSMVSPYTRVNEGLSKILKQEGLIDDFSVIEESGRKKIELTLKKQAGKVRCLEMKRISKPGRRVYLKAKKIKGLRGLGLVILSTPKGLLPARQALKDGLGGEVICKIV